MKVLIVLWIACAIWTVRAQTAYETTTAASHVKTTPKLRHVSIIESVFVCPKGMIFKHGDCRLIE